MTYIYWFRKDLRLNDNTALSAFLKLVQSNEFENILFLYIKNKNTYNFFGQKRIAFLYECLFDLNKSLEEIGFSLNVLSGDTISVFKNLIAKFGKLNVFANKQVEPYAINRDNKTAEILTSSESSFFLFNDSTVFAPGTVKKDDGFPYTVFTPFKKKFLSVLSPENYREIKVRIHTGKKPNKIVISENIYNLLKEEYKSLDKSSEFSGGKKIADSLLNTFIKTKVEKYKSQRDLPISNGTSKLSPYIHFGALSIRDCFRSAFSLLNRLNKSYERSVKLGISLDISEVQVWINELIWREFYYNITFHFPHVQNSCFREQFNNLKWINNFDLFSKWKDGLTGFPIVDAAMRQLKETGWVHNRLRMITASFLTKDLLIDWKFGEKYFAEELLDLDFSNNNGGWQWCASTGCDAQPYFRIFNPVLQSMKFDPDGKFIKLFLPELINLPPKYIHNPSVIPNLLADSFDFFPGKSYPMPIVEHQTMKTLALEMYKKIKEDS